MRHLKHAWVLSLVLACGLRGAVLGAEGEDRGWPRTIQQEDLTITLYQPQVESWKNNQLKERAAVSVRRSSQAQPTFGVIWLHARTVADKSRQLVSLEDVRITRASFPSARSEAAKYRQVIQQSAPAILRPVAPERLEANLAVTHLEERHAAPALKNSPPHVIYSASPALLVLVDGRPVLRDSGTAGILRVINTQPLLLMDRSNGRYYLRVSDRWMTSSSLGGRWQLAGSVPSEIESAGQAVIRSASSPTGEQTDLLDRPAIKESLARGEAPRIYVSTKPAELVQTRGTPQFQNVPGTRLLYVSNAANDLFLDTRNQQYYVLISGRWYRSPSLEGAWKYVAPKALPHDFARIPLNNPKGSVLASVPGTQQAQEAAISNEIPQTATIDRKKAGATVNYDGAPEFRPIEGTPLNYAINTPVPVIQVDPQSYFCVQNGVWFMSTSPTGPWYVATRVPAVIYNIPPSSPLYYVTYVYVYGYTPEYAYVGYLPGYLGSYATPDGVVVFGTGYYYPGWIGTVWYGAPWTFGFGIGWGWGWGWGFTLGFYGGYFGPCASPWWGPWHWGWGGWVHGPGPSGWHHGPEHVASIHHVGINQVNVYHGWSNQVVRNTWNRGGPPAAGYQRAGTAPGYTRAPVARGSDIYADHQGNVYRYGSRGWERYGGQGSQPGRSTTPPQAPGTSSVPPARRGPMVTPGTSPQQAGQIARSLGEERTRPFLGGETSHPSMHAPAPAPAPHAMAPSMPHAAAPSMPGGFSHGGFGGHGSGMGHGHH